MKNLILSMYCWSHLYKICLHQFLKHSKINALNVNDFDYGWSNMESNSLQCRRVCFFNLDYWSNERGECNRKLVSKLITQDILFSFFCIFCSDVFSHFYFSGRNVSAKRSVFVIFEFLDVLIINSWFVLFYHIFFGKVERSFGKKSFL